MGVNFGKGSSPTKGVVLSGVPGNIVTVYVTYATTVFATVNATVAVTIPTTVFATVNVTIPSTVQTTVNVTVGTSTVATAAPPVYVINTMPSYVTLASSDSHSNSVRLTMNMPTTVGLPGTKYIMAIGQLNATAATTLKVSRGWNPLYVATDNITRMSLWYMDEKYRTSTTTTVLGSGSPSSRNTGMIVAFSGCVSGAAFFEGNNVRIASASATPRNATVSAEASCRLATNWYCHGNVATITTAAWSGNSGGTWTTNAQVNIGYPTIMLATAPMSAAGVIGGGTFTPVGSTVIGYTNIGFAILPNKDLA